MSDKKTRIKLTSSQESDLILMVNCKCPKCGAPLMKKKGGKNIKLYEMAHIYPYSPSDREKILLAKEEILGGSPESIENIIPLCATPCHKYYDTEKTLSDYQKMKKLKEDIMSKSSIKNEFYLNNVEKSLKIAVSNLNSIVVDDSHFKLSYTGKSIGEKVKEDELIQLKNHIKFNVTTYFSHIQNSFKSEPILIKQYDRICSQVKTFFKSCQEHSHDKSIIFHSICEWFEEKINVTKEIGHILTSYFVQNCEVFE